MLAIKITDCRRVFAIEDGLFTISSLKSSLQQWSFVLTAFDFLQRKMVAQIPPPVVNKNCSGFVKSGFSCVSTHNSVCLFQCPVIIPFRNRLTSRRKFLHLCLCQHLPLPNHVSIIFPKLFWCLVKFFAFYSFDLLYFYKYPCSVSHLGCNKATK